MSRLTRLGRPSSRSHLPHADALLLRAAAWSVALQTALAVTLVVVVVSLGSVLVFDRQQSDEIRGVVQRAASTADDVGDPPDGVWLVQITASAAGNPAARTASPGTPLGAATAPGLDTAPLGPTTVDAGEDRWTGYVADRPVGRIVAIYDMSRHAAEEHRLLVATSAAGLLGVLLAALIGWLVARRAVRPLGDALSRQRRFVADASHELRTPLAVVNTRAQLLRMQHHGDATGPGIGAELDQLVSDTRVLGDVVADLLLSAQLDQTTPIGEEVDIATLAQAVVDSMSPYARQHGLALRTEIVPELRIQACLVRGAPTALRRALSALVDNAIAHSPAGESVLLQVSRDGADVQLTVVDHGDGLDPADTARLVERFARGSANGGGRRFGLGLALVDETVRAHRGRLEIDGAAGAGSTFSLIIPALPPPSA